MKKILFCLLSGALFLFSSCQSDELTTNGDPTEGNTVTSGGKTVKFTYNNTLPNVRTYYNIDENGGDGAAEHDAVQQPDKQPEADFRIDSIGQRHQHRKRHRSGNAGQCAQNYPRRHADCQGRKIPGIGHERHEGKKILIHDAPKKYRCREDRRRILSRKAARFPS